MGFNGGLMGFGDGLMGFNDGLMGFNGGLMRFNGSHPLIIEQFAIKHGHRNSEFSHRKMVDLSVVKLVFQRVIYIIS